MPDFEIFYKTSWNAASNWPTAGWDIFVSAFNSSDRVASVFAKAEATNKYWFVSPEYEYTQAEIPSDSSFVPTTGVDEATAIVELVAHLGPDLSARTICVDTTGFMRHHLLILLRSLQIAGVAEIDGLYAEPLKYVKKENTRFSDGEVQFVRQVAGFEGIHTPDTSNDLLIIGSGYDHPLISHAAEFKSNARKVQVLGFPSLRADMYQENVLRASKAAEQVGSRLEGGDLYFAPANDPFVTAQTLSEIVVKYSRNRPITNLYLCPLSTKALTLGFGIYYLSLWTGKPASIILPYCRTYSRETSIGVGRVWRYEIVLGSL